MPLASQERVEGSPDSVAIGRDSVGRWSRFGRDSVGRCSQSVAIRADSVGRCSQSVAIRSADARNRSRFGRNRSQSVAIGRDSVDWVAIRSRFGRPMVAKNGIDLGAWRGVASVS